MKLCLGMASLQKQVNYFCQVNHKYTYTFGAKFKLSNIYLAWFLTTYVYDMTAVFYLSHFQENTGWTTLEQFYALFECEGICYEYSCLEPLLKLIGIIREDRQINYEAFVALVDINTSVPKITIVKGTH